MQVIRWQTNAIKGIILGDSWIVRVKIGTSIISKVNFYDQEVLPLSPLYIYYAHISCIYILLESTHIYYYN